jgi:hypothetical protein
MKRIQVIGLCLVAVFAFSAIAATSAFAEPEFTKPGKGSFPIGFTSLGGKANLNTAKHTIECETVLDVGTILSQPTTTSSMLGDVEFTFHKCTTNVIKAGIPCTTSGQPSGLILTPTYLFHLGSLITLTNGEKHVLFEVLTNPATKFVCGTGIEEAKISITGQAVGIIPEKNKAGENQFVGARKTIEIGFTQSAAGTQTFNSLELTLPVKELMTKQELTTVIESVLGTETEKGSEVASGTETLSGGETVELKA